MTRGQKPSWDINAISEATTECPICSFAVRTKIELTEHRNSPECLTRKEMREHRDAGRAGTTLDRQSMLEKHGFSAIPGRALLKGNRLISILWTEAVAEVIVRSSNPELIDWGLAKAKLDPEFNAACTTIQMLSGPKAVKAHLETLYEEEKMRRIEAEEEQEAKHAANDPQQLVKWEVKKTLRKIARVLRVEVDKRSNEDLQSACIEEINRLQLLLSAARKDAQPRAQQQFDLNDLFPNTKKTR